MTATTKGSAVLTLPDDTTIQLTRAFAAPPDRVFRVLTEPDLVKRWWAGHHGTVTSAEIDLRVGGSWRYAMDAGGMEIAFRGEYLEIVPDERIVFTEIYQAGPGATDEEPGSRNTYSLTATDTGTMLTLITEVDSLATRNIIVQSGMESGVQEGWDLAEELAVGLAA